MQRETVLYLVTEAASEITANSPIPVAIDAPEETLLYGKDGPLDSLDLVSLILEIEDRVVETTGTTIRIADDRAMSQHRSPFRSIGSLTDYVVSLIA